MFSIRDFVNNGADDRIRLARIGNRGLALVRWTQPTKNPEKRAAQFAIYQTGDDIGTPQSDGGIIFTAGDLRHLAEVLGDLIERGDLDEVRDYADYERDKRRFVAFRTEQKRHAARGW